MQQYLELLKNIQNKGVLKPAARSNMPGTKSLFGYQFRHDLSKGFPLLTTKKINFKNIVIELLWFLRGDTNIKYLVDNGCNIWNEDAYNYYNRLIKENTSLPIMWKLPLDKFIEQVKNPILAEPVKGYKWGDCGYQYGKVWRRWKTDNVIKISTDLDTNTKHVVVTEIDQISNLINSLKNTPESRRHILTSIDPAHDNDLALYWCHALSQFNCRPLALHERIHIWFTEGKPNRDVVDDFNKCGRSNQIQLLDDSNIPKYYLDCQMYQRSADSILGVPYNIASYALLTHILCKICNMVPGEMVYSYGDVHIYENHLEAANEQLERIPHFLPTLEMSEYAKSVLPNTNIGVITVDDVIGCLSHVDFNLKNYNPQPPIKAKLSTGL